MMQHVKTSRNSVCTGGQTKRNWGLKRSCTCSLPQTSLVSNDRSGCTIIALLDPQCEHKQRQKKAFDKRHRVVDLRPLKPGEQVWVIYMNRRGTVKTHVTVPPRSYVLKTQHGDVRRNFRHLNPTRVAPTYDVLPADGDVPIDLNGVAEEPTAAAAPLARERQPLSRDVTLRESDICLPTCVIITLLSRVIDLKIQYTRWVMCL